MKRFSKKYKKSYGIAGVVIILVAAAGVSLLLATHAQSPYASTEAEGGSVTAPATTITDGNASNGHAVQFGSSSGSNPVPVGVPGNWTMKFDDEFNGTTLDSSAWSVGVDYGALPANPDTEHEGYAASQVVENGGVLSLNAIAKTISSNGYTFPDTSGGITSNNKKTFTFGYFEARVYLPGSSGTIYNWPAWWMDGKNWPVDGEIDIVEGLNGAAGYHFNHSNGSGGTVYDGGNASGDYTGWHVFGAKWEAGSINYYYDGKQVGQETNGITSQPMHLIFNLATSTPGTYGGPTVVPSTMQVDYVRVWQ